MTSSVARALISVAIIAAGTSILAMPASGFQDTCAPTNGGASCTGDTCCADASACYTDPAICMQMYCDNHPNSPSCTHTT